MRKRQKKQLLEITGLLLSIIEKVQKQSAHNCADTLMETLADVQEAVIACGESLEASEGKKYSGIVQLEQLCELIYQIGDLLQKGDDFNQICTEAREILSTVRENIDKQPIRLEILFMPYQVSMWDSLESVWLAAKDDPSVDAYVMPIPYYDVLQDNSLGELHYNGNEYPAEVPITDYREYCIEDRRPDIIFFHNPYDQGNTVTRVPERFYASHVCKYTDQLVYIPYMVSEEDGPSEGQTHTQGVLWADKVIVQPGSVYKNYCNGYTNFLREQGIEDRFAKAEDKFLPLGSPKFDKVLNTKCEIKDLPENWQKIIRKQDGSHKKIILYNLTITTMLAQNEQVLKKMDSVFHIFKQMQDEVVLLWRPHPLLLKTIDSMRPNLRQAYIERVEKFKAEGWGIYDDTPDPNLAMALSDAYYGDMSSLVTTYRATGKPILLQDVNII